MRDEKRIKPLLKRLRNVWLKNPDLRLGQIFENVRGNKDLFHIEDEQFIQMMELYHSEK